MSVKSQQHTEVSMVEIRARAVLKIGLLPLPLRTIL
jgi:hypothetical protein